MLNGPGPMAFKGIVTKVGFMNKTATVTVTRQVVHKKTQKVIDQSKKYLTHDEHNVLRQNDIVIIRNCRPISKLKRFELERVVASPEGERIVARQHLAERAAQLGASTDAFKIPGDVKGSAVERDAKAAEVGARSDADEGSRNAHAAKETRRL